MGKSQNLILGGNALKRITFLVLALVLLLVITGCNSAPVINSFTPSSLKIEAHTGETEHFSVNASDPDKNTTLTYSWVFKSGSPRSATGPAVDWTAPGDPIVTEAVVTVSDGKESVSKKWEITVKDPSPTIPGSLTSAGTKGKITLSWEASTGNDLASYYVYRGTSPGNLSKIATVNAPATTYEDTIVEDGALYYYHITSFGKSESQPSNQTYNMHGTRLTDTSADFTTIVADSPYVIENDILLKGDLSIVNNTKLYVLPGVDIVFGTEDVASLYVIQGLFVTKGTQANPISVSSFDSGYELRIIAAAAGSSLEYTEFQQLTGTDTTKAVCVSSCSPTFSHCRFISDGKTIEFASSGANVVNCYFSGLSLGFEQSVESTLNIESNIFLNSQNAILFSNFATGSAAPVVGMIHNNIFECNGIGNTHYSHADLSILALTDLAFTFPLAGNYFFRTDNYNAAITNQSGFIVYYDTKSPNQTFNFANLLTTRPTGAGPGWGTLPF